ncbi:hypothetical protein, partial [Burkholderia gladioli]|uniref:hypothetical protein n=1 Tax=Burkholderia gladioli TaxID=28095 RepID=UPI003F78CCF4
MPNRHDTKARIAGDAAPILAERLARSLRAHRRSGRCTRRTRLPSVIWRSLRTRVRSVQYDLARLSISARYA